MTTFPAPPGFLLINIEDPETSIPVVGWCQNGYGPGVMPLVPGRPGPLVAGDCVWSEHVTVDLATGESFSTLHDWTNAMEGTDKYRPGTVLWPKPAAAPAPVAGGIPKPAAAPGRPPAAPSKPKAKASPITDGVARLAFDGTLYAKQSFWQVPEEDPVLVFNMPPDSQAPKTGAKKITREQFAIIRKTIREVSVEELAAGVTLEVQPELPLDAEPAPEPDDADDMI